MGGFLRIFRTRISAPARFSHWFTHTHHCHRPARPGDPANTAREYWIARPSRAMTPIAVKVIETRFCAFLHRRPRRGDRTGRLQGISDAQGDVLAPRRGDDLDSD